MSTHVTVTGAALLLAVDAFAAPPDAADRVTAPEAAPTSPAERVVDPPIVAYAYTAFGAPRGSIGVAAYGVGLVPTSDQRAILGGGLTAWGSPVERLTLIVDATRDVNGELAPSAAGVVRLAGNGDEGWSAGVLGKLKVDGFAMGPNREIESELETGFLLSHRHAGFFLDAGAIGGVGLGDDGEVDVEGRLRVGHALGAHVRLGLDGQARARVAGTRSLAGGRTWDFAGGPQLFVGTARFFAAVTAGPATMGVWEGVGWSAIATVGAVPL